MVPAVVVAFTFVVKLPGGIEIPGGVVVNGDIVSDLKDAIAVTLLEHPPL